jgi:hypothetical protein
MLGKLFIMLSKRARGKPLSSAMAPSFESLGHFYLALTDAPTNSLHRGTLDTGQSEREELFGQRSTSARPEVASDISTRGVFLRPILASDILARFL